jgi:cell wall-associated NlpC family hydrolase
MIGVDGCAIGAAPWGAIGPIEIHRFATPEEAAGRAAFINEALSWIGTPFVNCGDVKGRGGAVDCAMLLVRSAVDTGLIPPFDPRPYSPDWMKHRSEEKFLDILEGLGGRQVESPRVGDVIVWQVARTFAHGAILINSRQVVHAYAAARCVLVSDRDEPMLTHHPLHAARIPRGVRFYDLWADRFGG